MLLWTAAITQNGATEAPSIGRSTRHKRPLRDYRPPPSRKAEEPEVRRRKKGFSKSITPSSLNLDAMLAGDDLSIT